MSGDQLGDMDVLSEAGINWADVGGLSDVGVNWLDVDMLSERVSIGWM